MAVSTRRNVRIEADNAVLEGILELPIETQGIVLFAHGSGSGRFSPRNRMVAEVLHGGGIGTLLFDLLQEWESNDREKVFDIELLAGRLLAATAWLESEPETRRLNVGYFGASTGAAAALEAAATLKDKIRAVVARGGRPDLAMRYLPEVTAPTLLIVGGEDYPVIAMNHEAYDALPGEKDMIIVPGATHLFEEPGALDEVANLALEWFEWRLADNH